MLHTDYHVQMPDNGLGHVAARVLQQLLAFDYVISAKGISNNETGHRLMEAVFTQSFGGDDLSKSASRLLEGASESATGVHKTRRLLDP